MNGDIMKFSDETIKERRILRLAQMIFDHWEEGSGMDTRYFDHPFINDVYTVNGQSINGCEYREHVVPRVYLRDRCLEFFDQGATIEDIKNILIKNLRIVKITNEEASRIDTLHKTTMPEDWVLGVSCPLERLRIAGIEIA